MNYSQMIQGGMPLIQQQFRNHKEDKRPGFVSDLLQVLGSHIKEAEIRFKRSMAGEEVGLPEDIHEYLLGLQELELQIQRLGLDGLPPESAAEVPGIVNETNTPVRQEVRTDKEYLTTEEVAILTSLSVQTIYNRVAAKTIPFCKGGQLRFKRTEIIQWLEAKRKMK